jgi:hypothetical protein
LYVIEKLGRLAIEGRPRKRVSRGEKGYHFDLFVPENQTIGHCRPVSLAFHGIPPFLERISKLVLGSPTGKSTFYREAKARAR